MSEVVKSGLSRRAVMALAGAAVPFSLVGRSHAQSAAWAQVVEAAKKEGSVTIYSGQGLEQLNDLGARFKKQYGINVQVVRAVESELLPKVDVEFSSGKGIAGIYVSSDMLVNKDRAAKGYIVPPIGPSFDNPAYRKNVRIPEGNYFECSAAILTFSWNKDLLPAGMKDYPDALNPALTGKIGISGVAAGAQVDFYTYLEEVYGADFTTKLAALKPRIYPGALPMAQAVVSGEIAVGMSTQPLTDEIEKGAPVGWAFPPKPWGARFWGFVLKSAPNPNAAQLLADFMVTQEGQEAVARKAGAVLPNIKGTLGSTDNVRQQDLSKLTPEYIAAYREKWKKLFQNS